MMFFEKFIDVDLGHVSYIVACDETKEALIVDPRRDIKDYVEFIERNSLSLKYIFNTHTHADYIGGHIELAKKYKVSNIFQKSAPIENYDILKVEDNDQLRVGNSLNIKVLETPGHTPFDICFLVSENNIEKVLFTGDLLFIGDIGRPDLLGEENLSSLANNSYISANKLWNLSDDIVVFTSHIEGSLCGKNLNRQYFSTIGIEKKANYSFSLSQEPKEKYMDNLISQNIETPEFFKRMAVVNISGPALMEDIMSNIKSVEFDEIEDKENIQIVDIREPESFHKNHIVGSINVCELANVSLISGNVLDYDKDIYLIGSNDSNIEEFVIKLLRVGLDNIKGTINNDFSLIDGAFLTSSNIISKEGITEEFINIVLDKNCGGFGNIVQSNISEAKGLDLSQYKKVFFSCNYGFKSSTILSYLRSLGNNDLYYKVNS